MRQLAKKQFDGLFVFGNLRSACDDAIAPHVLIAKTECRQVWLCQRRSLTRMNSLTLKNKSGILDCATRPGDHTYIKGSYSYVGQSLLSLRLRDILEDRFSKQPSSNLAQLAAKNGLLKCHEA